MMRVLDLSTSALCKTLCERQNRGSHLSTQMLVRCNQNEFWRSVCRFPDQFGLKRPDSVESKSVFENLHEIGQSRVSSENSISGNRYRKIPTINQVNRKLCVKTGRQTTSTDEKIIDFGPWEPYYVNLGVWDSVPSWRNITALYSPWFPATNIAECLRVGLWWMKTHFPKNLAHYVRWNYTRKIRVPRYSDRGSGSIWF